MNSKPELSVNSREVDHKGVKYKAGTVVMHHCGGIAAKMEKLDDAIAEDYFFCTGCGCRIETSKVKSYLAKYKLNRRNSDSVHIGQAK